MIPATITLQTWTNSDYSEEFQMVIAGVPVDLTSMTLKLVAREYAGAPSALFTLNTVANGEGVQIIDALTGWIGIRINKERVASAYQTLAPARASDTSFEAVYDLLFIHPDGVREVWMQGMIVLNKGIS